VQPYLDADIAISSSMKAEMFSNWFRSRNSDDESADPATTKEEMLKMIELVKLMKKASKIVFFKT